MEKSKRKVVMPFKDAVKRAIKKDMFFQIIGESIIICGIPGNDWPEGEEVINGAAAGYFIPEMFTTEKEDKKEPPEFIRNVYYAITAACSSVNCGECPLFLLDQCIVNILTRKILNNWKEFNGEE